MSKLYKVSCLAAIILNFSMNGLFAARLETGANEISGIINLSYTTYAYSNANFYIGASASYAYYFSSLWYVEGSALANYSASGADISFANIGAGVAFGLYRGLSHALTIAFPVGVTFSGPLRDFGTYYYVRDEFFIRPTVKYQVNENVVLGNGFKISTAYRHQQNDVFAYEQTNMAYILSWSYIW